MEHWIEVPPEPSELTLAWRAPESQADRRRWAVGLLSNHNSRPSFRYLEGDEFRVANFGHSPDELTTHGFRGYPTFELRKSDGGKFYDGVMEAFLRRLPPPTRSDFPRFLEFHRYRGRPLSPMSLLALTSARLPNDGFSLIDRLDPLSQASDLVLEIMGFRHRVHQPGLLKEGMELMLTAEPTNAFDPDAVRLDAADIPIGYVDRLQAASIATWLRTRSVSCWLCRQNGRPDAPRAFAFLSMRLGQNALAA